MARFINRRKPIKPTTIPTGPSKERSCETCRKRKVRCSEERPACSNCIKSSLNHGTSVCCVYSQRSVFYTPTPQAESPSPSQGAVGESQPQATGHHVGAGGVERRGSEALVANGEDDGRSTTPALGASPFEHVNTPSTAGTTPPASPLLKGSELVEDDGLVDYDAEGETDYDDDELFEARPILASSLLAAPPSTPFAASFPASSFGAQPPHFLPPPNPFSLPLYRNCNLAPIQQQQHVILQVIPRPLHRLSLVGPSPAESPRRYTAPCPLGAGPHLSPTLRADGTLANATNGAVGFWDEGPLSKEEVMGWSSLQQSASARRSC